MPAPRLAKDVPMDQVSRPLLIALGATVALLLIWLVALRPKPVSVSDTPLAPTQAVPQAKDAAAGADAANAKVQAATGSQPAATPAPSTATPVTPAAPAAPAAAAAPAKAGPPPARRDAAVLRDIRSGKVVVLLFWNAKGADDIATRGAIRDLDRHKGKVAVHVAPITQVAQYPSIAQGVKVQQSPSTLIIDRKRRTRVITGLSEPRELSQAVSDALAGR